MIFSLSGHRRARRASPLGDLRFCLVWDYYMGDRPHNEIFRRVSAVV